ncbi:UrcA family protein [Sandarakinorhabdus sp.]|uniref:UrcA family protein n=1 Tax=Sandarakinorhabdus sp. TaxID=1916663 RepID=UPI003F6E4EDA
MFASTRNFSRNLAGLAGTLLFAGLCVGAATAPAAASQLKSPIAYGVNAEGDRTARVFHSDLNLGSKAGQAQLETRLRIAARTVCSNGQQDPFATAAANRCYHETLRATRNATMAAVASGKQAG